jgi:hypothetical protein
VTDILINTMRWRDGDNSWRIRAFCAMSTAASRHIDARYAAAGTEPGSAAAVHAADLRTSLDDRRAAHSLLTADPSRVDTVTDPADVQRNGLWTIEAVTRFRPHIAERNRRRAADREAWLNERRRTDPTRLDYVGPRP